VLSNRGDPVLYRVPSLLSLSVLTSGPVPPNPQELLSRPAFGHLLERLREKHDVIIVDTPAAEHSADAYMIAARAGAAVIIARQNGTRYPKLKQLGERLESVGVAMIGSVMNEY
jgi:receptor protein-tyrosine kinase